MPVALQSERFDFPPVTVRADIERNPAIVTHVGGDPVPGIRGQQALLIHAHPKAQGEPLTVMSRQGEGSLARLPDRVTKLTILARLRQLKTQLAKGLEHRYAPCGLHGVDFTGG